MTATTFQTVGRFNLLLLEEGEYYFEDVSAYYYPPGIEDNQQAKRRVKGRLNLCSHSIIFDPEDYKLPITKFPFKYIDFIRQYSGPLSTMLPQKADIFIVRSRQTVRMKENNVNAPYIFKDETEDHRFSLQYVPLDTFLPKVLNLFALIDQPQSQSEYELKQIIEDTENSTPFDTSALVDLNEKILKETTGLWVTPLVNNPGRLLITNQIIYFQPFNNISIHKVEKYQLKNIIRISKRRYVLRHVGIEVFMNNETSLFLAFKSTELRDNIYDLLLSQPVIQNKSDDQANVTLKWQNGLISNFDYLMYLNHQAGRSFNDLTQYPVFPWVLSDYTSRVLDLSNPRVYRDLSKPIGALNPERLEMLVDRMEQMPEPKFLYGTHYSTPGYVLFYLVREEPEFMLRLQNGKFDHPSRMFRSIAETWTGVLNNPADVKELIPEFYETSRRGTFLINSQRLGLGTTENGHPIDDVILPPWADSAENFVSQCRDALESDYVSDHIHEWIDLIFGYKQQGPEAIRANNVFYHLTYEGAVDLEKIVDPMEKAAMIAQIKEFGQTPKQLWNTPHPTRLPKHLRSSGNETAFTSVHEQEVSEIYIPLHAEPLVNLLKPLHKTWGNLSSLEFDFSFKLHKDTITSLCLSTDASTLFTVSQDTSIKVYSISDKKQLRSANPCELALSSCQLVSDEKTIVIGSWDNNIYLYSIETGRVVDMVPAHDDAVSCIALRGDTLISGSWDATVRVWNFKGNSVGHIPTADFFDHDTEVRCVDIDPMLNFAASGSEDGTLVIYDLKMQSVLRSLQLHNHSINALRFTPEGTRLVTCSSDGYVKLIELNGSEIFSVNIREPLKCLATDGETLLLGGEDGVLRVWNLKSGAEEKQIKTSEPITSIACAEDGSVVVIGCGSSIRVHRK